MIPLRGGHRGGGRESAGRSGVALRAGETPRDKKKVDFSNAWQEARALVWARRGRLSVGLLDIYRQGPVTDGFAVDAA